MLKIKLMMLKNRLFTESGYISIIALLLLILGLFLVPTLLNFVSSGQKTTGEVYKQKISQQYAADAGVSKAMWYIKYQNSNVPSTFSINLNNKNVTVNITPTSNADNSTTYDIQSTVESTVINAQINYKRLWRQSRLRLILIFLAMPWPQDWGVISR